MELISNIAYFFKGAVSIKCLEEMPLYRIFELRDDALKINKKLEQQMKSKKNGL